MLTWPVFLFVLGVALWFYVLVQHKRADGTWRFDADDVIILLLATIAVKAIWG